MKWCEAGGKLHLRRSEAAERDCVHAEDVVGTQVFVTPTIQVKMLPTPRPGKLIAPCCCSSTLVRGR